MAIDKQTAPLDSPASLTDWQRLIDITDTLALSFKNPWPVKVVTGTGYIIRGSVFYIGGAWYKANIDVAITGTETDYIQLTVDNVNNLVTAEYVATLTDVSWNDQWNGWYDTTGKFYVFDEALAYGEGLIDFPRTVAYSRPKNTETAKANATAYGANWANFLANSVDTVQHDVVSVGLPNTVYTDYNLVSRKNIGETAFGTDAWTELALIQFKGKQSATLSAFRVLWSNTAPKAGNYVRIMDGDTLISIWNDLTQNGVPFDITGLDYEGEKNLSLQYKEYSPPGVTGPITVDISSSCITGTRLPNLFEYVFNLFRGWLT